MTTPPAVYGQFGYTLALAERRLTAVLREHLAQRDVQPETWYALRLIATLGPGAARQAVLDELASSRTLNAGAARDRLARLDADGLIRGGHEVDLTSDGEALLRQPARLHRRPGGAAAEPVRARRRRDHGAHAARGRRPGERRVRSRAGFLTAA